MRTASAPSRGDPSRALTRAGLIFDEAVKGPREPSGEWPFGKPTSCCVDWPNGAKRSGFCVKFSGDEGESGTARKDPGVTSDDSPDAGDEKYDLVDFVGELPASLPSPPFAIPSETAPAGG